jgi:hypothetical protein
MSLAASQAVATPTPTVGTVVPVTPCRVADSRNWITLTTFFAYQTEDQQITGNCGVPATASAAILNFTVVPQNNWQGGFLTIYPTGGTRPEVSQVSYNWYTITGEVTAKLSDTGSVTIFNGSPGTADVIVDVAAYINGTSGTY